MTSGALVYHTAVYGVVGWTSTRPFACAVIGECLLDDLRCLFFRTLVKDRIKLAFTEVEANEVINPILVKWLEFCR